MGEVVIEISSDFMTENSLVEDIFGKFLAQGKCHIFSKGLLSSLKVMMFRKSMAIYSTLRWRC